ncbi:class I SAM-dependent methyltransferase [Endozoicomonas elysicola]|uniref:SAM-dependent methyltransferase n=1 Tax=Endozoicomonas elysicola TaxID=305900 RepID=A0A081KAU0_9GAMM|nr:class I SAM-dependent methyltransferase [Endozoicomonas elysicola]KEI71266.1 SAM-dependent methyltransferase [Endozoicomonas elysicola]
MELESIVPWGRTLQEYESMFCLDERDIKKRILGCGDGPASFNAELSNLGGDAVSVDPIYQFSRDQIAGRIEYVRPKIMQQVRKNSGDYLWNSISSPEELELMRMTAMRKFLSDYDEGKISNRYIDASLPELPFQDKEFDLALCSHFLFLYSEHFSEPMHLKSIIELLRVAKEIRIYPLISLDNSPSIHLPQVLSSLKELDVKVELRAVGYEFQKGADHMLVATAG